MPPTETPFDAIKTLLDAGQPIPVKQWEEIMAHLVDAMIQCPNCGQWFDDDESTEGDQPKCPNCGTQTPARMEPS